MIFGKYVIEDWSQKEYYRQVETVPIQHFWSRNILLNNIESYISLKSPWSPGEGIIIFDCFILGFDPGNVIYSANPAFIFNDLFKTITGEIFHKFNNVDVGKKFVDDTLDKIIKLKAFL